MFKKRKDDVSLIKQEIETLKVEFKDIFKVYEEKSLSEREFNLLCEKSELQNKVINIQERIIKLTDDLAVSNKTVKNQAKEITEFKEKVKNLSLDYSKQMNYKSKYEDVKKQNIKLEKKLEKLEAEGIVIPKKVTGSTMPKKKQAVKETVRPVKG